MFIFYKHFLILSRRNFKEDKVGWKILIFPPPEFVPNHQPHKVSKPQAHPAIKLLPQGNILGLKVINIGIKLHKG